MIHVCYALCDRKGTYSKFAGTSMCSLLLNTDAEVMLHLLHDDTLTEENRLLFEKLAKEHGAELRFYPVQSLAPRQIEFLEREIAGFSESRFSPATVYRLMAGMLLPKEIERLIYLDADTVVNLNIRELWEQPLQGAPLAVVSEREATLGCPAQQYLVDSGMVPADKYFNAGVLLLDMNEFRKAENILQDGVRLLQENPQCFCYDQDILNFFFARDARLLGREFNDFVVSERYRGTGRAEQHIYHYAGKAADVFVMDEYVKLFLHYFTKTPWWNGKLAERLFQGMVDSFEARKQTLCRQLDFAAGKRRIFYGDAGMEQQLKERFRLNEKDLCCNIVGAEGSLDVGSLLRWMSEQENAVHIFFLDIYDDLKPYLERKGYQEDIDFVDGRQYLLAGDGGWQLCGVEFFEDL